MGKALYIHPHWPDIRDANYRENQFAGTQGGGALFWYSHGFRLPLESDVPYRPVDYVPSNWASTVQKEANDFNFSLFTRNVLQAPRYYSATFSQSIAPEQLRNPAAYEQILSLGYEISAHLRDETYGGAHNFFWLASTRAIRRRRAFS